MLIIFIFFIYMSLCDDYQKTMTNPFQAITCIQVIYIKMIPPKNT